MKIVRYIGIVLSGMLLISMFQAVAMPYAMYKGYKTYKDPVARAAAIERMKEVQAAAQERLQSGMAYTQEKVAHFRRWVAQNQTKIIAATVALAIILTTIGTVAHGKRAYREQILQVFRDHGVDLSNKAVRDYCYTMGAIVNSKDEKAFRRIFTNAEQSKIYEEFKAKTSGFEAAMKYLGSRTIIRITPEEAARTEATSAEHGTGIKLKPWYSPWYRP